jgi:hypothetical protein
MADEAMTDQTKTAATGGCRCGAVRYRAEGKVKWTSYCHCRSCRHATGAPVAAFAGFHEGQFSYTNGAPQVYESSPGVWRSFCGRCGSPLTYRAKTYPGEVHVYTGSLDAPKDFPPGVHVFCAERISWFETSDEAERFDTLPPKTG